MNNKTKIVILGAGYAGVVAGRKLSKLFKKNPDVEISLIDKNDSHVLLTELHEVAGNRIDPDGIKVSLEKCFRYTGVKIIRDRIENIDFDNKKLEGKKIYEYDYLILATGSEPAFFGIKGMEDNSFTLWSFEDALRIKQQILDMFQGARYEKDPNIRQEMLTFVVGGGGFTGVEMMGELMEWVNRLCKQYDIDRNEVKLYLVEGLPTILPVLSNVSIKKAENFMKKNGVELINSAFITSVSPNVITLKSDNKDSSIQTRTLIWTGGVQGNQFVIKQGIKPGKKGRALVNDYLEIEDKDKVYAIGDIAYHEDKDGNMMPALVESAMQSGETAAHNVKVAIMGGEKKPLEINLHGNMVSIGAIYSVAEVMGRKFSGVISTILKHLVNMHYLWEIGGAVLIWDYIIDQFVKADNGINIFWDHLKRRSQTFWILPLRLYLGFEWLRSGLDKINLGWLGNDYALIGGTGTGADAEATATIMSLVSNHTPGWYAWIVDTIIIPNAFIFQKLIVATEIGLGLAFLSGTFTFIAAIVSIGMNINFILSTGLNDYWFLASSIPMLGGAGRVFGLDHYLLPALNRWAQRISRKE